jgi:hypothetical protein
VNRRSFLSFLGLAPLMALPALPTLAAAASVIGIDAGSRDVTAIFIVYTCRESDLQFICSRQIPVEEVVQWFRIPPHRIFPVKQIRHFHRARPSQSRGCA